MCLKYDGSLTLKTQFMPYIQKYEQELLMDKLLLTNKQYRKKVLSIRCEIYEDDDKYINDTSMLAICQMFLEKQISSIFAPINYTQY